MGRSEASAQLGRICGSCALAFLLLVVVMVILESWGLGKKFIAHAVVALPLALFAIVGLISFTSDPFEFQLAGRRITPVFSGMAAAAEWTPAALLLGAPASLFLSGYDGRPLLIGLTGGYVLLAVLIGPFLRNCGARTVPQFMAARYGGLVGLLAVVVLVACSVIFIIALIQAAVPITARALAVNFDIALWVVIVVPVLCALPGGMAGVTATQVAQYTVLLVGALATFFIYAANSYDAPAGGAYDPVAQALEAAVKGLGLAPAPSPRSVAFQFSQTLDELQLIVCLMTGTASLPAILMYSLITPAMGEARTSAVWALFFISLLVLALPTHMMLSSSAWTQEQSSVLTALVPAIAVTSMLAAISALLLTIANCLEQDVYCRIFPYRMASRRRSAVGRVFMVVVAGLVAYAAGQDGFEPSSMLAWAFSLAAAGFFPALVMGIWWSRTTSAGAAAGIVGGFGLCLFYLATDGANEGKGAFALAAGFLITATISLLGKKPSAQRQAFLDALRAPGAHRGLEIRE